MKDKYNSQDAKKLTDMLNEIAASVAQAQRFAAERNLEFSYSVECYVCGTWQYGEWGGGEWR